MTRPEARLDAGGPQRYDGPRLGQGYAVRRVALHSMGRAIGLRRGTGAKIVPALTVLVAILPAVVFTGVSVLLPGVLSVGDLIRYPDYYGFVLLALVLFSALVAPELLCPDRRSGLLGLYFAAPLDRRSYLLSKVLACLPLLGLITLLPPLVLLIGLTSAGAGPGSVGDVALLLLRMLAAGTVLSVCFTALALALSSLTDRRAVAAVCTLLFLLLSGAVSGASVAAGAPGSVRLLDLPSVAFELVQRLYGVSGEVAGQPTWALVGSALTWVVASGALLARRYATVAVTR